MVPLLKLTMLDQVCMLQIWLGMHPQLWSRLNPVKWLHLQGHVTVCFYILPSCVDEELGPPDGIQNH